MAAIAATVFVTRQGPCDSADALFGRLGMCCFCAAALATAAVVPAAVIHSLRVLASTLSADDVAAQIQAAMATVGLSVPVPLVLSPLEERTEAVDLGGLAAAAAAPLATSAARHAAPSGSISLQPSAPA
eukprot:SAG11_NODE_3093_length_2700_cov_1.726644_2_plen_129_part_00